MLAGGAGILGTRVIPGLLDRYLGARAVEGQQSDEPLPPGRRDNLWKPVPGDHGAHGRFDALATARSAQLWLTMHRGAMLAAAAALLIGWRRFSGARANRRQSQSGL